MKPSEDKKLITCKNILNFLKQEGPVSQEQCIEFFVSKSGTKPEKLQHRLLDLMKRLEDKGQIILKPETKVYEIKKLE